MLKVRGNPGEQLIDTAEQLDLKRSLVLGHFEQLFALKECIGNYLAFLDTTQSKMWTSAPKKQKTISTTN